MTAFESPEAGPPRAPAPPSPEAPQRGAEALTYQRFAGFAAIAVAVATLPVLLWALSDVILLAFGAVLFAALLSIVAEPFGRWTPLPAWLSLTLSGLIVAGLFLGAAWVFGSEFVAELGDVTSRIETATGELKGFLAGNEVGKYVVGQIRGTDVSVTATLQRAFALGTSAFEALIIVVISAVYLVIQPRAYRRGLVTLVPPRHRGGAEGLLDEIGHALRLWLIGQIVQMAIIGALSTLAVWLIGLPSIFALGLIAFTAEFVPYLGPIAAAVPAVAVAFTQSPRAALWTLVAYLLIHQVEGNLVTPLIQRWLIFIPPALILVGIASIGTLFGLAGVIFAGPIVVVLFVAVRKLYVRDALGDPVSTLTEGGARSPGVSG